MTVSLRRARTSDRPWIDALGAASAQPLGIDGPGAGSLLNDRDVKVSIIARDGDDVGLIAWNVDGSTAAIRLVALEPSQARRGAGIQAAAIVERSLKRRGVRTVFAPATEHHGIAMYFWIRLGYRPLLRGEWPCEHPGVVWLRRDLVDHVAARQKKGSQSRIALKTSSP